VTAASAAALVYRFVQPRAIIYIFIIGGGRCHKLRAAV
jgi:hypothetical protein